MLVFDVVEQFGDVAAQDLGERPLAPKREDIFGNDAAVLGRRAQPVLVDVAPEPLGGDGGDAVGLGLWRLERRQPCSSRLITERARSRASAIGVSAVDPILIHRCLPNGSRAMT